MPSLLMKADAADVSSRPPSSSPPKSWACRDTAEGISASLWLLLAAGSQPLAPKAGEILTTHGLKNK